MELEEQEENWRRKRRTRVAGRVEGELKKLEEQESQRSRKITGKVRGVEKLRSRKMTGKVGGAGGKQKVSWRSMTRMRENRSSQRAEGVERELKKSKEQKRGAI